MKQTFVIIFLFTALLTAEDTLFIRPAQSKDDISHDYYQSLLQLVMNKTEASHGKTVVLCSPKNMTQKRSLMELEKGSFIDVDWAGTSTEREKKLGTIFIPLNKGLLGYRIPVIRKADSALFASIHTIKQLQELPCIQGTHWPDSDILEASAIQVRRTPMFSSMYPMLINKRAAWFPRGINEVYAEVSSVGDAVMAYDDLIIAYPFPMYFFVQKRREQLRERIEMGLRKAIDDGSFDKHMKNHKAFASVFPLSRLDHSRIIHLKNPYLSKETPLEDTTLWLQIGKQVK